MDCPKCVGELLPQKFEGTVVLRRCSDCFGLWVKPDALNELQEAWMSEAVLDIGSPKIGERLNDVKDVACPEGHGAMLKCADAEQVHISYEQCQTCEGIYLDAGEFTDLKFKTPLDFIRGLFVRR